MPGIGRSLRDGLKATNPYPYLVWMYRVGILVSVVAIFVILLDVHGPALSSEAAETASGLVEILGVFIVAMVVAWVLEVGVKAWQVYGGETDRHQVEVSDVE